MKLTELSKKQESKLNDYKEIYLNKFFNPEKEASLKEITEYMHWFYAEFNISTNKTPQVILCDNPVDLIKEINAIQKKSQNWYDYSYYLSAFNSWIAYFDFFDKECFTLDKTGQFNKYKKILDLNILWAIPFDSHVFVSKNAKKYLRDSNNALHSVTEAAVQFYGNSENDMYFIHGLHISKTTFLQVFNKTFTFEQWAKIQNEEEKAIICVFMEELFGSEYLYRFLSEHLKEVDTYIDKKKECYLENTTKSTNIGVYTLFKGKINNSEIAFVRCFCPSTDRLFFLSVESDYSNAKTAIASLYRIPKKLVPEIKYIQRQGERFSTTFTEKGLTLLKTLSKQELENLVSVSGEVYFSKMRYEY